MNYQVLLSQMLGGTLMSLRIFFSTLLFSLPLGLLVALGRMSKNPIINLPVRFYILVMRGTPLMLQLLFIFYGLKPIFGIQLDRVISAQVAFALNYAAYFAEIFRGGIEGVPAGQREAGQVLGMTKHQIFFKITLLQMIKRVVPPMSNEIITLVKDTSLARIIAAYELTFAGAAFMKSDGLTWPLFYTGVFYLIFIGILTLLFNYIERKLDYFK